MLTGKKQMERQKARVKELSGSKCKMQGRGMAEVQMVKRNLSKFLASRGWHWTETGSGGQSQTEVNTLMTGGHVPG